MLYPIRLGVGSQASPIYDVDTPYRGTVDQQLVCKASVDHAHDAGLKLRASCSIIYQVILYEEQYCLHWLLMEASCAVACLHIPVIDFRK